MSLKNTNETTDSRESNFCSFPFRNVFTLNNGSIKLCCDSKDIANLQNQNIEEAWNSPEWRKIRLEFKEGKRPEHCQTCWRKEDLGQVSARDNDGKVTHWLNTIDETGRSAQKPQTLSIRIGSQCNLKCVMCSPMNSTKWNEDATIYNKFFPENHTSKISSPLLLKDDWLLSSLEQARHITFIGGEPLISRQQEQVVDFLISENLAQEVTLCYRTNLTHLPANLAEKWKKFKAIEVVASVDGFSEVYNYIRFPGEWQTFAHNMLTLDSFDIEQMTIDACYVYMNINALSLENLYLWRNSVEWRRRPPIIRPDYIEQPDFFQTNILSEKKKDQVIKSLERLRDSLSVHTHEKQLAQDMMIRTLTTPTDKEEKRKILGSYLLHLDRKRKTDSRVLDLW